MENKQCAHEFECAHESFSCIIYFVLHVLHSSRMIVDRATRVFWGLIFNGQYIISYMIILAFKDVSQVQ